MQQRQMATLLAKFRIDYSDVTVIPDVTKKADPSTKSEFDSMIAGCDISEDHLKEEREKTNRYLFLLILGFEALRQWRP